jgi:hypothetical protein
MAGRRTPCRPVPTELAALAAGVAPSTVRKWVSRGRITRYGTASRAIFDLCELLRIAAERDGLPVAEVCPDCTGDPAK